MTLHWHTDANPCLLCGVPVTPEAWAGGVWGGTADGYEHWYECDDDDFLALKLDNTRPIFPPRGWAGKSDAELWAAVFGTSPTILFQDGPLHVCVHGGPYWAGAGISLSKWEPGGCTHRLISDLTAKSYILALQNALVIHKRLEVPHE